MSRYVESEGQRLFETYATGTTALDLSPVTMFTLLTRRRIPDGLESCLKIDRSFVSGPDAGNRNRLIVDAIARLAQGFDLKVIAQGIETQDQADLMRCYCQEGQGYFFGKRMTAAAFQAAFAGSEREHQQVA